MAQICNATRSLPSGSTGFYIDYSITDYPDKVVISSSAIITASIDAYVYDVHSVKIRNMSTTSGWYVNGNQYPITDTSTLRCSTPGTTATKTLASAQTTVNKAHSSQNISVLVSIRLESVAANHSYIWLAEPTGTIAISAKTSYTVSFDANGGTNPPANQTKWYGEALTIQEATPKKDGYTFLGWATSPENAALGPEGIAYTVGSSYTADTGAVLYAVWELTYEKPKIPSSSIHIDRCKQNGQSDDDGGYALVTFDWSIFKSSLARYYGGSTAPYSNNSVSNCTVTVGTRTATKTLTGASGTAVPVVVGNNTFDPDTSYNVTISITDSQTVISDHTTTVTGILPKALFPIDFNANASAVGFFMPAPDNGNGAYFGRDIFVPQTVNIKKDTINASLANNNLSSAVYPGVLIQDTAGRMLAKVEGVINATGEIGIALHSKNYNTSGTAFSTSAAFLSTVDKSGTQVTSFRGNTINVGNSSTSTVNVKGQALADFIVAQGTSGIWRYRKWNSGVSECWALQAKSFTMTSGYGTDQYYTTGSETFPSGLFKSNTQPIVTATRQGQDTSGLVTISVYGVTNTTMTYYVFNSGVVYSPANIGIAIHAYGVWK